MGRTPAQTRPGNAWTHGQTKPEHQQANQGCSLEQYALSLQIAVVEVLLGVLEEMRPGSPCAQALGHIRGTVVGSRSN